MSIQGSDLLEIVKDHIEIQPLEVNCAKCERELITGIYIDSNLDIFVSVQPCDCLTEEE